MEEEGKKTILMFPTKKNPIFGWYVKDGIPIGEDSKFGEVFQVCDDSDCNYVIKIILGSSHKKIKKEVEIQKLCAKHNLCKPVEDWWLIKGRRTLDIENLFTLDDFIFPESGGVIITPILKETFGRRIERESDPKKRIRLIKKAWEIISKLHQIGIIHNDAHYDNLMFDGKGNLYFIDMGKAIRLEKENKYIEYRRIIRDYSSVIHNIEGVEEYFSVVLKIIKKEMWKEIDEGTSVRKAEKKVVGKILKMKNIDLDILVGEYPRFQGSSFL